MKLFYYNIIEKQQQQKNIINYIIYMYLKKIIHVDLQYSIDHKLEPLKK